MFQKLLASALVLFALLGVVKAQNPPPLTQQNWDVHDPNGSMHLEIKVTFAFVDASGSTWYFTEVKKTGDAAVLSRGILIRPVGGSGTYLRAYSGDSQNWFSWEWDTDHYDKVGGTPNERSYWPMRQQ